MYPRGVVLKAYSLKSSLNSFSTSWAVERDDSPQGTPCNTTPPPSPPSPIYISIKTTQYIKSKVKVYSFKQNIRKPELMYLGVNDFILFLPSICGFPFIFSCLICKKRKEKKFTITMFRQRTLIKHLE